MGITIQNGLIKEIYSDRIDYKDQLTFLLTKLADKFPNYKFKVDMSGWFENGKITSLNYHIFAANHPIWFSEFDIESIDSAYFKIIKKISEYEQIEAVNVEEEKYEGGLF